MRVRPAVETEAYMVSPLRFDAAELQSSFYPARSWRGRFVRALFILLLFPLWGVALYYIIPWNGTGFIAAILLINLFYLVLLTGTLLTLILILTGSFRHYHHPVYHLSLVLVVFIVAAYFHCCYYSSVWIANQENALWEIYNVSSTLGSAFVSGSV